MSVCHLCVHLKEMGLLFNKFTIDSSKLKTWKIHHPFK
jgi:hypothetical protein